MSQNTQKTKSHDTASQRGAEHRTRFDSHRAQRPNDAGIKVRDANEAGIKKNPEFGETIETSKKDQYFNAFGAGGGRPKK